MTRLRWHRYGQMYTTMDIIANKDVYFALIDIPSKKVYLYNSKKCIKQFKAKTIPLAKKWAKKEFVKLGAIIYDEVRNGNATTKSADSR